MPLSDFGVVVATYAGDFHFARGCLESIHRAMPDVPVCLLVDGDLPTTRLAKTYGLTVVTRREVRDPFLREHSFSFGHTKMVALWEAPFERFLYLDADTIVWQDVRNVVDVTAHDLLTSTPHEPNPPSQIGGQYFDLDRLFDYVESFEWRDRAYFNSGAFVVRRGSMNFDLYRDLFYLQQRTPNLLLAGEQGILNLMAIRGQDAGTLDWGHARLQQILGGGGQFDGFANPPWRVPEFKVDDGGSVAEAGHPAVLHWAAGKPDIRTGFEGADLMTHFRRLSLRRMYPWLTPVEDRVLLTEGRTWVARRALRKGPRHMIGVARREATRRLLRSGS